MALGVACGPSGWRNWLLQAIADRPKGLQSIATWSQLWTRRYVQPRTVRLFTAAVVTAVDGGYTGNPSEEHGLREDRKVRPIACAEVLIKLCEGVDVKLERKNLDRSFEGVQFGNGAPDGPRRLSMQPGLGRKRRKNIRLAGSNESGWRQTKGNWRTKGRQDLTAWTPWMSRGQRRVITISRCPSRGSRI